MKKSQLFQFLLTLFLGPLGLFYSSIAAGIGFVLAAFSFGAFTYGLGALLLWPISILVGFFTVSKYNGLIDKEDKKHQELLQASKDKNKNNLKVNLTKKDEIPQEKLQVSKEVEKENKRESYKNIGEYRRSNSKTNLPEEDAIMQKPLQVSKEDENNLKVNLLEEDKPPW